MLRAGHGLMLIVVGLLTLGVVMVTSAGLTVHPASGGDDLGFFEVLVSRPAIFAALAVVLMAIGSRVPVGRLCTGGGIACPVPWMAAGIVLLLLAVHVPGLGREMNGARRWIALGPIGFQPSEAAKWGMLAVLAWYGARRAERMGWIREGFLIPMAFVAVVCVLIVTEDLGTAVLILLVSLAVLYAAGTRLWQIALLLPFIAAGFAAAVVASPYRVDRLRAFLDPYEDPQGIGYHVLQSMAAVSGGGLAGRGLGNGIQKFGYLPEDTTDFIFAVICEELGIVGAAIVVCLYLALLLCGFSIIRRVEQPFQRLLGFGILLTIGLQALVNLLVVTGLAPTKGIALPLVSAGGTGWCLTAFSVGLLVSMERAGVREGAIAEAPAHCREADGPPGEIVAGEVM